MINTDKKWNQLYNEYILSDFKSWNEYFKVKIKLKKSFYMLIEKYSANKKPVLECGSGTGKFSVYLAANGFKAYAIDIEDEMVEQTRKLSNTICPNNPVNVFKGDICSIPYTNKYFSVAHSSGVLEHFEDNKIVELINEQLRVADTVIFSVPSQYFEKKMLGNERFLSRKSWRRIISKSNATIVQESGYHYKTLSKRIHDIVVNPKKLFKPIALFTFVLQEKTTNYNFIE